MFKACFSNWSFSKRHLLRETVVVSLALFYQKTSIWEQWHFLDVFFHLDERSCHSPREWFVMVLVTCGRICCSINHDKQGKNPDILHYWNRAVFGLIYSVSIQKPLKYIIFLLLILFKRNVPRAALSIKMYVV